MTFFERVDGLCKQHSIAPSKLALDLGHSKSITAAWRSPDCKIRPGTKKGIAAYFGITVDELMKGVDKPIDYASINTDEFFQPRWQEFLEANNYNEKKAIRAYLEFEKAQAQDAMSEPTPTVFQNNGENYGMIGNAHAPVTINGAPHSLSDQEAELLRIFSELSLIDRSKVIVYAAELKEKEGRA